MRLADVIKRHVFANVHAQLEGDTTFFQLLDTAHDHVFFQLEAGDAVGQQAASAVVTVIDSHLQASTTQHVSGCQTTRTSTDDANALFTLGNRCDGFNPALFPRGVGDVFLDRADGHSAMAGLFDDAVAFTQTVLRADTATDFRECVGGLRHLIRFLQTTFGGQTQPVGNVVVQRAMRLTVRHATLAATRRLLFRFRVSKLCIDFIEILFALCGTALFGHIPIDLYEFQHRLVCHQANSLNCGLDAPYTQGRSERKVSTTYLNKDFPARFI